MPIVAKVLFYFMHLRIKLAVPFLDSFFLFIGPVHGMGLRGSYRTGIAAIGNIVAYHFHFKTTISQIDRNLDHE